MARAIFSTKTTKKVTVVRQPKSSILTKELSSRALFSGSTTLTEFSNFWSLMDTIERHGYLRAAMSLFGRATVGAWWTLKQSDLFKSAPKTKRNKLLRFYNMPVKSWENIKDFYNIAYKLMIAVMYLKYFGFAAFEILRNTNGDAVGLDFLHGFTVPNVDGKGKFKTPAFIQYPSRNITDRVEFASAKDVIYVVNPDWEGSTSGGSDIESLTTFSLPLDIYLQTAARDYMKNRDKPEVVYELADDLADEGFDAFVDEIYSRHAGAANLGKNPIVVQGEFKVHELRPLPDSLPYQESRKDARSELLSAAGVPGVKLGITDEASSANIREMRREFHESSLLPLFKLIEIAFYEQIHIREFSSAEWEFSFNSPDFLNAVELATVHLRYRQMRTISVNEIRRKQGLPELDDDVANDPMWDGKLADVPNPRGNPPEGRPVNPDDPSQTGEPNDDYEEPVRGDQHDDSRLLMLGEVRAWRNYVLKRLSSNKALNRKFNPELIPLPIAEAIQVELDVAGITYDDAVEVFNTAYSEINRRVRADG